MNPNVLVNLDTCSLMNISLVFTAMKFFFAKMCATATVTVLALATLDKVKQIGSALFVLHCQGTQGKCRYYRC